MAFKMKYSSKGFPFQGQLVQGQADVSASVGEGLEGMEENISDVSGKAQCTGECEQWNDETQTCDPIKDCEDGGGDIAKEVVTGAITGGVG